MTRATRPLEYNGKTAYVYLAFGLGVDEWKLGFGAELGGRPRVRVAPAPDLARLAREIAAGKQWFELSAAAAVRSCYEIGRDGFWLHRYWTSTGLDKRVVDSSSIEINRCQRRAKSDGLDVGKLLGLLVPYRAGVAGERNLKPGSVRTTCAAVVGCSRREGSRATVAETLGYAPMPMGTHGVDARRLRDRRRQELTRSRTPPGRSLNRSPMSPAWRP